MGRRLLATCSIKAGGSDGKTLDSARRALEQISEFATHISLENGGLPASALFVTSFLWWVDANARSRARLSRWHDGRSWSAFGPPVPLSASTCADRGE
eukprot:6212830-Pleurochrysis_carterae.AAC.5